MASAANSQRAKTGLGRSMNGPARSATAQRKRSAGYYSFRAGSVRPILFVLLVLMIFDEPPGAVGVLGRHFQVDRQSDQARLGGLVGAFDEALDTFVLQGVLDDLRLDGI